MFSTSVIEWALKKKVVTYFIKEATYHLAFIGVFETVQTPLDRLQ
jgi:hypothetical protein